MNKKLEEIHKLLPDNTSGKIIEGNVRECFTKTFDYADEVKGISDAPSDNKQYARKNGAWEDISAKATPTIADVLRAGNQLSGNQFAGELKLQETKLTYSGNFSAGGRAMLYSSTNSADGSQVVMSIAPGATFFKFGGSYKDNGTYKDTILSVEKGKIKVTGGTLEGTTYIAPTKDEEYVQKKYVDTKLVSSGGAEAPTPKINIKGCSFAGNKSARLEFEVSGYPNFSNDYDNILAESLLCLSIDATEFLLDNLRENMLTNYGTGNDHAGVFIEVELPTSVTTALENYNHSNRFNFACYLKLKHGTGYIQETFFYKNSSKYNQSGYVDITFKAGKNPATNFNSTTETGVLNLSKDIDEMPINKQLAFLNDNTQVSFGTSYDLTQIFLDNGKLVPNTAIAQVTDWEFDLAVEDGSSAISPTSPWCIVAEKELEGGTFEVVGYGVITDNWTGGETNRNSRAVVRTITTSDMLFGARKGLRFRVQPTKFMVGSQQQVKIAVNKVRRISYSIS